MLLDAQNLFSDNQSITTGTIISDNIVRFGKNDVSYVPFLAQATQDFSNLESLTLKIETCKDEDFSEATILAQSTLNLAQLKAGAKFPIAYLPKGNLGYMRLTYTTVGTTETTGKITAGVVAGNDLSHHEL